MLSRVLHYKNSLPEINKKASAARTAKEFIRDINHFIIDNQISDKAISFHEKTPQVASWNIGCGSRWVNPDSPVGSLAAGLPNPTFDLEKKVTKEGHQERMSCCAEILKQMRGTFGVKTIALQEAPLDLQDPFYQIGPIHSGQNKGNIRLAIYGAINPTKCMDPFESELAALMLRNGILMHEVQARRGSENELLLNLHFDWSLLGAANRKHRVAFLLGVMKFAETANIPLYVMGDTNLDYSDIVTCLPKAALFGANGCNTVDMIMNQDIDFCYLSSYRHLNYSHKMMSNRGILLDAMRDSFRCNFEMEREDVRVRKGKTAGMVQFHFKTEKQAIHFAEIAFKLFEAFDAESSIVIRADQPLVIRLSEKQYEALRKQLREDSFSPYEKLATSFEKERVLEVF